MRKTTILLSGTLALLLPLVAGAQMMGGGNHHGSTPVTPPPSNGLHGGSGSMHGGGNDSMGGAMSCAMAGGHGIGNGLTVASDGTLLLTLVGEPAARPQLRAVRGGTVRWTKELPGALAKMLVNGERVLTVTESSIDDERAPKTTVTAYAVATGAMIWTIDLDGAGRDAALFDGGVYLVLGTGDGEESMEEAHCGGDDMDEDMEDESMMKSSVAAISAEGKVLWTMPLEP